MSKNNNSTAPSIDFSVQELFYDQVHSELDENGFYVFKASGVELVRKGKHLVGNNSSLEEVRKEVSEHYFKQKFRHEGTADTN
jgi:spermidine synthase